MTVDDLTPDQRADIEEQRKRLPKLIEETRRAAEANARAEEKRQKALRKIWRERA